MRALILEDDDRLRAILQRAAIRVGLACDEASSLEQASELADLHEYDLLLLDRRLPDGDGLQLCRELRKKGFGNSILMVTAADDSQSTVEGLSEGADDYIGKPFDVDVLEARMKALLRRNERRPATELRAGALLLDPWRRSVTSHGEPLSLTAREFRILESLMRKAGAVVTREELMEQAWGEREEPMSNTIDVLIARLRKKLERGDGTPIETVRGMGYLLRVN